MANPTRPGRETAFEKQRGIGLVEVRTGFAQVHVSELPTPVHEGRLTVLKAVAEIGISMDFLKLTPSGVSFIIANGNSADVENALRPLGFRSTIRKDRSVVLVHAVNMRDEEGLTARVVQKAIATGAIVDHISDMHDRMMIVVEAKYADALVQEFQGVQHGQ